MGTTFPNLMNICLLENSFLAFYHGICTHIKGIQLKDGLEQEQTPLEKQITDPTLCKTHSNRSKYRMRFFFFGCLLPEQVSGSAINKLSTVQYQHSISIVPYSKVPFSSQTKGEGGGSQRSQLGSRVDDFTFTLTNSGCHPLQHFTMSASSICPNLGTAPPNLK